MHYWIVNHYYLHVLTKVHRSCFLCLRSLLRELATGISREVWFSVCNMACTCPLNKDFLPRVAAAVAQATKSERIETPRRGFLACLRRLSARWTDWSSPISFGSSTDRCHADGYGACNRRITARMARTIGQVKSTSAKASRADWLRQVHVHRRSSQYHWPGSLRMRADKLSLNAAVMVRASEWGIGASNSTSKSEPSGRRVP